MNQTNAQAALQAAVTLHARLSDNDINAHARRVVLSSAKEFKKWLDGNAEPLPNVIELSPTDRQLLRDLEPRPTFPVTSHKGLGF